MVLIDMPMPKSCGDCPLTYDESVSGETKCCLGVRWIDWEERPGDCPIEETIYISKDSDKEGAGE